MAALLSGEADVGADVFDGAVEGFGFAGVAADFGTADAGTEAACGESCFAIEDGWIEESGAVVVGADDCVMGAGVAEAGVA